MHYQKHYCIFAITQSDMTQGSKVYIYYINTMNSQLEMAYRPKGLGHKTMGEINQPALQ